MLEDNLLLQWAPLQMLDATEPATGNERNKEGALTLYMGIFAAASDGRRAWSACAVR